MEDISFFSSIFIGFSIIGLTIYSLYSGFGKKSKELRDPFEEHED